MVEIGARLQRAIEEITGNDALAPIDPLTGRPAELLPGRPKGSSYPGKNPPRPMPMGGAKDD